jgi:hypothetical protein
MTGATGLRDKSPGAWELQQRSKQNRFVTLATNVIMGMADSVWTGSVLAVSLYFDFVLERVFTVCVEGCNCYPPPYELSGIYLHVSTRSCTRKTSARVKGPVRLFVSWFCVYVLRCHFASQDT